MPVLDARTAANPWSPTERESVVEAVPRSRMPTHAERARTIVGSNRLAVVSIVPGDAGLPVGMVVPYAIDERGTPSFGVRCAITEAMQLQGGMPVSLTVAETPLTASHAGVIGGVTLMGKLRAVKRSDRDHDAITQSYARMQPAEASALKRGASTLYLLNPAVVLLTITVGDGDVERVDIDEYKAASSDPLAAVAPGLISHMGDADGALVLLCRAFGGQPGATGARLAGVDQHGIDLLVTTAKGRESVRLSFGHPVSTADEVRRELTTMARAARFKLGVG